MLAVDHGSLGAVRFNRLAYVAVRCRRDKDVNDKKINFTKYYKNITNNELNLL